MTTRLFVNLTQAYIPLYLQITLRLHAQYVAIIPLVMFIFGFLTSIVMKSVNNKIGRKTTFIIGCAVGLAGCIWINFGCSIDRLVFLIFLNLDYYYHIFFLKLP